MTPACSTLCGAMLKYGVTILPCTWVQTAAMDAVMFENSLSSFTAGVVP